MSIYGMNICPGTDSFAKYVESMRLCENSMKDIIMVLLRKETE